MNGLSINEILKLNQLITNIRSRMVSSTHLSEFVNLINKSGIENQDELTRYINRAGFNSVEEFNQQYNTIKNQEFWDGLIKIGLAILFAYALSEIFKRK
ncbi:MAG: hypothetical protein KAU20_01820 [Nanoarchaeota archaeon]|nr:hypothetical protein [Nanoarchaeota archaeon]